MLVDSHCHLDFSVLSKDRDGVLARARAAGVGCFLTAGTTLTEFPKIREIVDVYPDVYGSVGIHPHEAEKPGEKVTAEDLVALADHPKIIGIGETGLDYFYDHAPREAQQRNFRAHIRACLKADLPLIIHTREAEEDTAQILREETAKSGSPLRGVFHCFSSDRWLGEEGLKRGFYVSFSGMITFKKAEAVRAFAKDVPLDRILVETDAPYLAPEPFRGKDCEPAYVARTADFLAELKGIDPAQFAQQTTENFFNLFTKARRP